MPPVVSEGTEAQKKGPLTEAMAAPPATVAPQSSGFRARLEGLSLFDLVQLECLARSRRIVRVASAGRVGYLYFNEGEIVHAGTRNLVGERAALEIMGWNDGVFEVCNIAWPERTTITMRWQQLLLLAAKAKDDASGKLVHLPNRRMPSSPLSGFEEPEETAPEAERTPQITEPTVKADSVPPSSVQQAVRIDGSGQVLSIVGDDGEFGGLVAYASRLAGLIGDAFGLDQFKALDVCLASSRCILYTEDKGGVVAVRARNDVDLSSVMKRAGL
ncbi:MAG TPA: DUF4388 domain-containing protein [Polyangiaceae bacterium]|nr:DUF4388 domain-containing protein [Polyangiaceae bacterium]